MPLLFNTHTLEILPSYQKLKIEKRERRKGRKNEKIEKK